MKKIIILSLSLIIIFTSVNTVNADKLSKRLYKETILGKYKIEKEYKNGKELNKKIEDLFIDYRYNKDKISAENLRKVLKEKIVELNNKSHLSRNDRKKLDIYNNMYYRCVLLLDYQLK